MLLEEIVKIKGLERLRISSIEITELNDEFLSILKNNPVIVSHLHIPLQAGSDKILKLMNRKYDKEYFRNKIKEIRSIRPDISITTDVIVGFPDESDDDFNETCEFSKEIGFSKIHVFPYSRRSGTKADTMPNQVDEIIKKERVNKLIEVSNKLEKEYMDSFINKEVEVLIEKNIDNKSVGHTGNYLKVEVDGNIPRNTFVKVMIKERINDCLKGERND
jgi:threonylcarbamoyladenosine tRNA methylthiotransferase MtaB